MSVLRRAALGLILALVLAPQALADGDFQSELVRLGFEPVRDVGPDTAAGVFQDELARWTPILKAVGGKPE